MKRSETPSMSRTAKTGKVTVIRKICNFLGFEKSYNLPLCEPTISLVSIL